MVERSLERLAAVGTLRSDAGLGVRSQHLFERIDDTYTNACASGAKAIVAGWSTPEERRTLVGEAE